MIDRPAHRGHIDSCSLGGGVFAAHVIGLQAVLAKGEEQSNPIQIGSQTYIDAEPPAVYLNHSCKPNAGGGTPPSCAAVESA
jgi:hypothetical protein